MESGLNQFGAYFVGEANIGIPPEHCETPSQFDIEIVATEAFRQILPLLGSSADEMTDTGYTYRELNEALKRLNP